MGGSASSYANTGIALDLIRAGKPCRPHDQWYSKAKFPEKKNTHCNLNKWAENIIFNLFSWNINTVYLLNIYSFC